MRISSRFSLLAVVGAVALLLCATRPACAADWVDHKSEDGGFTVRFPSEPKTSVQSVETAIGKLDMHMIISEKGSMGYTVIYAKFPPAVEQVPSEQLLEGAKQGIASRGITISSSKKVTMGNYTGLELKGSDANGLHLRARLFMVKTTMFQILLASRNEKELTDDSAEKFVESFKLLNTPSKK
jgi:hypothetical protein